MKYIFPYFIFCTYFSWSNFGLEWFNIDIFFIDEFSLIYLVDFNSLFLLQFREINQWLYRKYHKNRSLL